MNILRNVRRGYSGDGMGCGPCAGFDAVDPVVEQEEEKQQKRYRYHLLRLLRR